MEYFALSVPLKITHAVQKLCSRVSIQLVVGVSIFGSRIKNKVGTSVDIKEGDRVQVRITVRYCSTKISISKDLMLALRAGGVLEEFNALPTAESSSSVCLPKSGLQLIAYLSGN